MHGALLLHPHIHEGYAKELALHWEALEDGASPVSRRRFLANLRRVSPKPAPGAILLNSDPFAHQGGRLRALHALVPNARIFFMLRDPAARTISALLQLHRASAARVNGAAAPLPTPSSLLRDVHRIINASAAVEGGGGAMCLAAGVPLDAALPALRAAALLPAPIFRGALPLPHDLEGRIVPCGDPRAAAGAGAMAVWPLHAAPPPHGLAFYLAPIIEAIDAFGPASVDVRWLEDFRADPATHLSGVVRLLGLQPLAAPPRTEAELADVLRRSQGSVAQLVRTTWASVDNRSSGASPRTVGLTTAACSASHGTCAQSVLRRDEASRGLIEHHHSDFSDAYSILEHFYAPFERARRAYFAWASKAGCARLASDHAFVSAAAGSADVVY